MKSILTALTGTPEPPCRVLQCPHECECHEGKACMAFYRYVSSASGRFPSAPYFREPNDFYYHKIFAEE